MNKCERVIEEETKRERERDKREKSDMDRETLLMKGRV